MLREGGGREERGGGGRVGGGGGSLQATNRVYPLPLELWFAHVGNNTSGFKSLQCPRRCASDRASWPTSSCSISTAAGRSATTSSTATRCHSNCRHWATKTWR